MYTTKQQTFEEIHPLSHHERAVEHKAQQEDDNMLDWAMDLAESRYYGDDQEEEQD